MKNSQNVYKKSAVFKTLSILGAIGLLHINNAKAFQGNFSIGIGGGYASNPCACYLPSPYGMYGNGYGTMGMPYGYGMPMMTGGMGVGMGSSMAGGAGILSSIVSAVKGLLGSNNDNANNNSNGNFAINGSVNGGFGNSGVGSSANSSGMYMANGMFNSGSNNRILGATPEAYASTYATTAALAGVVAMNGRVAPVMGMGSQNTLIVNSPLTTMPYQGVVSGSVGVTYARNYAGH